MIKHVSKNIIVIVSAYLSGAMLPILFRGRGYSCVHVTTRRELEIKRLQSCFDPNGFIENHIVEDESEITEVVAALKKFNVKAIIPGCESGVPLADNLSQHFSVAKNEYRLSKARRNKFYMIDAIKQHGVLCADQFKTNNLPAMLAWFKSHGEKRVVVKPLSSSSSDGVFYCHDEAEMTCAFHAILNQHDMYNMKNSEVLVQEFLPGDEYIVNTVSRDGVHFVTDIWRGVSENTDLVSNDSYAELVHPEENVYHELSSYVVEVLNALAIKNGAAHSEIRVTPKGPCLIETGARLAGKVDFAAVESIFGYSQLSLACEALLEPDVFKGRAAKIAHTNKYARYVYFFSNIDGDVVHEPDLSSLLAVESVISVNFSLRKGDKLRRTSKAFKSPRPGYAYLVSDTKEQLEKDYLALRIAEEKLYSSILDDQ